ncbi:MAG: hypothetical protein GX905_09770 [Bacteroidales bacterium]|nr:hypothetical protein [Bacteroidales bacterium]
MRALEYTIWEYKDTPNLFYATLSFHENNELFWVYADKAVISIVGDGEYKG